MKKEIINWLKINWFKTSILFFLFFSVVSYYYLIYLPDFKLKQTIGGQLVSNMSSNSLEINNATFLQTLIGQLISTNLGYLSIAVAVLGILGGVFVYFNIKPLKEALEKQEETINNLREEAGELLIQSKEQSEKDLGQFRINQKESLAAILKQQKETIDLETKNRLQEIEKEFLAKIEVISEDKDTKLKEFILSETNNRLAKTDKSLTAVSSALKDELNKNQSKIDRTIDELKSFDRGLDREIKELKIYNFSKDGKMGAIMYSIELLGKDIEDDAKLNIVEDDWRITRSLERLKNEIKDAKLDSEDISDIEGHFAKIEKNPKYSFLIEEIRKKYKR